MKDDNYKLIIFILVTIGVLWLINKAVDSVMNVSYVLGMGFACLICYIGYLVFIKERNE